MRHLRLADALSVVLVVPRKALQQFECNERAAYSTLRPVLFKKAEVLDLDTTQLTC